MIPDVHLDERHPWKLTFTFNSPWRVSGLQCRVHAVQFPLESWVGGRSNFDSIHEGHWVLPDYEHRCANHWAILSSRWFLEYYIPRCTYNSLFWCPQRVLVLYLFCAVSLMIFREFMPSTNASQWIIWFWGVLFICQAPKRCITPAVVVSWHCQRKRSWRNRPVFVTIGSLWYNWITTT